MSETTRKSRSKSLDFDFFLMQERPSVKKVLAYEKEVKVWSRAQLQHMEQCQR